MTTRGGHALSALVRSSLLEWLVALAMIAFVSLSLAQVFLLPAGEGFDEPAHYSYVSLLADEGRIPVMGKDMGDALWERRNRRLPGSYRGPLTKVTYREFFGRPDTVRREAEAAWRTKPPEAGRYEPGQYMNWQGQHPPLYYALLVPVYKLTAGESPAQRVLWMRLATVIIGMMSIVFLWLAWGAAVTETRRRLALGVAVAALTPSLVLDVARLGNEAATMAIAAALFWQMLALRVTRRPWLTVVVIGVLLGLGLLTKGFFVGFAPGVLVAVALIARHRFRRRTVLAQCVVVVLLCAAISGWWFVGSHRLYGLWVPTHDALKPSGGGGLGPAAFAAEFAGGLALRWATYFYCGTWSWALVPIWWYVPFAVVSALFLVGFVGRFKPAFWRSGEAAILLPLVPLLAAYLAHLVFVVRHEGVAHGGGHYLHAGWPFIALLVGGALVQLRRYWLRALLAAALVGCFLAARAGDVAQLLITGGIGEKAEGAFIHVPPGTGLDAVGTALHNLAELVPLGPGLMFYALGVAAQAAVVVLTCRWLLKGKKPGDGGASPGR